MRLKLALIWLGLSVPATAPLFGEEAVKQPVEVTRTERVSIAPGGAIRLMDSFGSLNVEGWDRPEVEITVVKSLERYCEPKRQEKAARALERVRVVAERRSDSELAVSTFLPHGLAHASGSQGGLMRKTGATLDKLASFARHPLGGKGGIAVEYQIHAPRDSRLIIHHGSGRVLVSNVSGDMEVTSSSGDILLMLPDSGTYSIDARSKLGTVSSDFEGNSHRRHVVGSGFARAIPAPSRRIHLRTGIGGITIKAVPLEAEEAAVAHSR